MILYIYIYIYTHEYIHYLIELSRNREGTLRNPGNLALPAGKLDLCSTLIDHFFDVLTTL